MEEKRLQILFLEDVQEDAELVERALRKEGMDFEMHRVDTKDEFLDAIRAHTYDVVLSDHSLPQFNSSEALKLFRRLGITVPFILVTGSVSEEFAITRLKEGADDYILKSSLSRLSSAISNALNQKKLQSQRLEAELALRNQNEELIKINQELDSFVYSVSHDLRAPLRSLLGLLNISIKDEHPRDKVYDTYFRMMEGSVKKLDDTLKDILEYSRNARNELTLETIDLDELIQSCISKLEYMHGFNQVRIDINKTGGEIPFSSDRYRLSVVISNLLSNAIKYRDPEKGESHLKIDVNVTESKVGLIFQDNGIGIDETLLSKVFNMFFRGTERSDGAGLGLYIIKETVQKLRGTIDVTSTLGAGSEFVIIVPNFIGKRSAIQSSK